MQGKNMIYAIRWLKKNFIMITYENKGYDKLDKWITLTHTHQKMYDEKYFQKGVKTKKGEFVQHKRTKQKGRVETWFRAM